MLWKTICVLSLCLLSFTTSGQPGIVNYQSFLIDNKEVYWTQIYHFEEPKEAISRKIFEHLKKKLWITNIAYEGTEIIADFSDYKADYKRYGGKFMNTSTIVRTGRWRGKVRISFKEDKYRVLLSELNYDAIQATTGSGKATIQAHEVTGSLSEWALNKYRNSFRKNRMMNLDILHFSFKDSFTLSLNQVIDNDW